MSLVSFAVRLCLVMAQRGRTVAEDRVYESLITPLPTLAEDGPEPLMVVSSDDDLSQRAAVGRVWSRELDMAIEFLFASGMTIHEGAATIEVPHTDRDMERALDLTVARFWRNLDDPTNPWAEMFRAFRGEGMKVLRRRGASVEKGARFAARQIILTLDPLQEPDYWSGQIWPIWDQLLAAMRAEPDLAGWAPILEAELRGPDLPSWQRMQAQFGQTRAAMDALGLGALPGGEAEPPVTRLTVQTPRGDLVVYPE